MFIFGLNLCGLSMAVISQFTQTKVVQGLSMKNDLKQIQKFSFAILKQKSSKIISFDKDFVKIWLNGIFTFKQGLFTWGVIFEKRRALIHKQMFERTRFMHLDAHC